ncbi:hypothetical protein M9H77_31163 [Catharanthus roseus]|uniref:Uncharacterized protein n=1 Tax=Catharanthus roseus TaxID=4058 RepID=A0ACC0A085_CATRO|nr:hypothetical protein M9H77_31163 [Catharanthus roseus]
MLVDKPNALFAYSLISLEYLGSFHSIVPFNTSMSNVVRFLLLFEAMDSRTNHFKGGAEGMTHDAQRIIELLRGAQQEHFKGSKTFLLSKVKVEELKEASLGGFIASKSKEEECLEPTAIGRAHPTIHGRALALEEKSALNLLPIIGPPTVVSSFPRPIDDGRPRPTVDSRSDSQTIFGSKPYWHSMMDLPSTVGLGPLSFGFYSFKLF